MTLSYYSIPGFFFSIHRDYTKPLLIYRSIMWQISESSCRWSSRTSFLGIDCKTCKVIDYTGFLEKRPGVITADQKKVIGMEREGKPRLRNKRAHASNLTKTFSHKSSLSSSDRASNWKNLTATPIQLERTAKSSSCIGDWATGKANGSQGIISNQTKLLGDIISKELKALESFVKEHNAT